MWGKALYDILDESNLDNLQSYLEDHEDFDINSRNEEQKTILMLAAQKGSTHLVRWLLYEKKVNPNLNTGTPNYETALTCAVDEGKTDIVEILLNDKNCSKTDKEVAFLYYASIGDVKKVKKCIQEGVDINATYRQRTALSEAIACKHVSVVQLLLDQIDINVNVVNCCHETPLLSAIITEDRRLINLFLTREDTDLHIQGYLTSTPLTYAIYSEQYEVAKILLTKEKNFNIADHPEALNWAIRNEEIDIIKALLEKDADVNCLGDAKGIARPDWVWTGEFTENYYPIDMHESGDLPINWAIRANNIEIIELLDQKEADFKKENAVGKSAVMLYETLKQTLSQEIQDFMKTKITKKSPEIWGRIGIFVDAKHREYPEHEWQKIDKIKTTIDMEKISDTSLNTQQINFEDDHISQVFFSEAQGNAEQKLIAIFKNGLPWDNIPDFSIITGINGSGKSQLLQYIYRSIPNSLRKKVLHLNSFDELISDHFSTAQNLSWHIENEDFLSEVQEYFQGIIEIQNAKTSEDVKRCLKKVNQVQKLPKNIHETVLDENTNAAFYEAFEMESPNTPLNSVTPNHLQIPSNHEKVNKEKKKNYKTKFNELFREKYQQTSPWLFPIIDAIDFDIQRNNITLQDALAADYIKKVAKRTIAYDSNSLTFSRPIGFLTQIATDYQKRLEIIERQAKELVSALELYRYYNETTKQNTMDLESFLKKIESNSDFRKDIIKRYALNTVGAYPLDNIQQLLEKYGFQNKITLEKESSNFKIKLKTSEGSVINPSELSSGERMILAMITWLFYAQDLNVDHQKKSAIKIKNRIKVILFDEPDRHFDPKLCQLFYRILYEEFVQFQNIQVIMTTHRIDSVIQAPTNNIFLLSRQSGVFEVKQVHKLEALFRMSSNLRDLMGYHHKVYTESTQDALFYELTYSALYKLSDKYREQNFLSHNQTEKTEWKITDKDHYRVFSRRYQFSFYSVSEQDDSQKSSKGRGGCQDVIKLIKKDKTAYEILNSKNNPLEFYLAFNNYAYWTKMHKLFDNLKFYRSYGILDKDYGINHNLEEAFETDHLVTLKRHSLENYLFDPIIFCSALSEPEIKACINKSNLGVKSKDKAAELILLCHEIKQLLSKCNYKNLQKKIDNYFVTVFDTMSKNKHDYKNKNEEKIYEDIKNQNFSKIKKKTVTFIPVYSEGNFSLQYPMTFLEVRGHDIEQLFFGKKCKISGSESSSTSSSNPSPASPADVIIRNLYRTGLYYVPLDLAEVFFTLNDKIRANVTSVIKPREKKEQRCNM